MIPILISALVFKVTLSMSALRLGPDSSSNDISIIYNKDIDHYALVIQRSFYYMTRPFSLCFRLRPISLQGDTCSLTNNTGPYDCLARNITTLAYMAWTLSNDLHVKSNVQTFIPSSANEIADTLSLSLSLKGILTAQNKSFSFVGRPNSVFEILASDSYDVGGSGVVIKRAYMSTFYEQFGITSDNLIMPTQMQCSIYSGVINLIFLGRRFRQGNDYYFVAFINYHPNRKNFQMWQGLSFSKNKVNRDMIGVYPSRAIVQDLFSLYKTSPFLDTSPNINGTNDWQILGTSQIVNQGNPFWFYYVQTYRVFQTNDELGDQVLRFKVGNQYCYAAYIDTNMGIPEHAFMLKEFKHQLLNCFLPDLTLSGELFLSLFFIIVFLI